MWTSFHVYIWTQSYYTHAGETCVHGWCIYECCKVCACAHLDRVTAHSEVRHVYMGAVNFPSEQLCMCTFLDRVTAHSQIGLVYMDAIHFPCEHMFMFLFGQNHCPLSGDMCTLLLHSVHVNKLACVLWTQSHWILAGQTVVNWSCTVYMWTSVHVYICTQSHCTQSVHTGRSNMQTLVMHSVHVTNCACVHFETEPLHTGTKTCILGCCAASMQGKPGWSGTSGRRQYQSKYTHFVCHKEQIQDSLRYAKRKLSLKAKICVLWNVLSDWFQWIKTTYPAGQNMP